MLHTGGGAGNVAARGVVGRFAPTPSGPLHAGSLVAALASWLDARANDGRWLIRIEDLDTPRNSPGAAEILLGQLARCGLVADAAPALQSGRVARYRVALDALLARGDAYRCGCTRKELARAAVVDDDRPGAMSRRVRERVYPGTCRTGLHGRLARSVRLRLDRTSSVAWHDRRLGEQSQDVATEVGDFVLERADGVIAYQLAVVVDDAADGITDVVRGEDLAGNTARQIVLQRRLGLPTPRYLHVALVVGADGEKLSKQNGAAAVETGAPASALAALRAAGSALGLDVPAGSVPEWLAQATSRWRDVWPMPQRVAEPAT